MSNKKHMMIDLIVGLIKRLNWMKFHCIKMCQYFPKPYEPFVGDIDAKVDLSNYATEADFKNISHVDTSNFFIKIKFS